MCPQSPFWKQSLLKPAMFKLDKKLLSLLSPWGFLCTCSSCYFDSFLLGIHSDPRGISVSRLVSMYCLFFVFFFCITSTRICRAPGEGRHGVVCLGYRKAWGRASRIQVRGGWTWQGTLAHLSGVWLADFRRYRDMEEVRLRRSRWTS